jgi:hypothetical protein
MEETAKFYEASDDAIAKFNEVFEKRAFPTNVSIKFVGSSKLKKMINVSILPEKYSFAMGKELFVMINEDLMDAYDGDEIVTILIEQELDKVGIDGKTGRLKSNPLSFITSPGLLNKYGLEKVGRANQVDELSIKQYADKL